MSTTTLASSITAFDDEGNRRPKPVCACGKPCDEFWDGRWHWHTTCFRCRNPEPPTCTCGGTIHEVWEGSNGLEWRYRCRTCIDFTGRMYVNVYAVSRHYGGPEEGGWWFNAGEPLGSVPVAAEVIHSTVVPVDDCHVDAIKSQLRLLFGEGDDIFSVNGREAIQVSLEDSFAAPWPATTPHYE